MSIYEVRVWDAAELALMPPAPYLLSPSEAKQPKPTNADRIRAMTDEELATYIAKLCKPEGACSPSCRGCGYVRTCDDAWLDWLKQEESHDTD